MDGIASDGTYGSAYVGEQAWYSECTAETGNPYRTPSAIDRGLQQEWGEPLDGTGWQRPDQEYPSDPYWANGRREYSNFSGQPGVFTQRPGMVDAISQPVAAFQWNVETALRDNGLPPFLPDGLSAPTYLDTQVTSSNPPIRRSPRIAQHYASTATSTPATRRRSHGPRNLTGVGPFPPAEIPRAPPPQPQPPTPRYSCDNQVCVQRGTTFGRPADLERHIRNYHTSTERYVCRECGRPQDRLDKMWEHCRKSHHQSRGSYRIDTRPRRPSLQRGTTEMMASMSVS